LEIKEEERSRKEEGKSNQSCYENRRRCLLYVYSSSACERRKQRLITKPKLPLHDTSRSSSPSPTFTPTTLAHPPPLYSPHHLPTSSTSSTFPILSSQSIIRKSLDPSPRDRTWNRRKAFICIAVGVVVLLVIPLTVFAGILHATREGKGNCRDGNETVLDGVRVCET